MKPSEAAVYVVDDDTSVRQAVCMLLRSVGYRPIPCATAAELLDKLQPEVTGCIILDVRMPGMSGLQLQEHMNKHQLVLPIIFITGHGDVDMAVVAMKEGAFDFLQKPFKDQVLLDSLERALQKDQERRERLKGKFRLMEKLELLTARERNVLDGMVAGKANKVTALDLGVSERTVEAHRARVMEKMQARSLAELVQEMVLLND
ncbi:MAG TPA: response regulator [Gammaproteobacteria bacterium]|nr:response regulator [Gammaproteobacteria bacterium]